jgi:2-amino-4-hydroxy-6-hydroxymethyldihydropteridine diphosphokinase
MSANLAFLALGSNVEPETNLPNAVRLLESVGIIRATSQVWQTAPVGFSEQPDFLNAVVLLETDLPVEQIINSVIPTIEQSLERRRDPNNKNAPRTIDVDLVMFNDMRGKILGHEIPDPEILARPFIAVPLAEIAPTILHPVTGETLPQIAARVRVGSTLKPRDDVQLHKKNVSWLIR